MNHQDFIGKDMFYFSTVDGMPKLLRCRVNMITILDDRVIYHVQAYEGSCDEKHKEIKLDSFNCFPDQFEAAQCFNEAQSIFELKVRL